MIRPIFVIVSLLVATLACSLSPQDDADPATVVPSVQPIGEVIAVTPTNPPSNTATPQPTQTATNVPCQVQTNYGSVTVQQGDTLFSIAQRNNTTVDELVTVNCLANANAIRVGQTLYVPNLSNSPPTQPPVSNTTTNDNQTNNDNTNSGTTACSNTWFFDFRSDVSETLCPDIIYSSTASGQDFEGGRVYFYQASGIYTSNLIYVIYNDGTWQVFTDTWDSSQPFDDPNIAPPSDREQPVAGIGKVWREQASVRDKLGWAYSDEVGFTGRRQAPTDSSTRLYIDHGVRGLVLQLDSGTNTWNVAGGY